MFWSRNKKINFQLPILILRPELNTSASTLIFQTPCLLKILTLRKTLDQIINEHLKTESTNKIISLNFFQKLSRNEESKTRKAKIRDRYNQVPHLTHTPYGKVTKTQENTTQKRAKRSTLSKQVITRLQVTD